jgi:CubicO group peptidase (beta-lactamase class C family)
VSPDLVATMRARAGEAAYLPTAERDLRTAVILLAAGLGMGGLGVGLWYGLMNVDDLSAWTTGGWVGGAGAILALVGLVHLGFWLARRSNVNRASAPLHKAT